MQRRGIGDRERHESAVTAVYRAGLDDRGFERSEKPVPIPEGTRGALDASGCGSMRTGFFGYEKSKSALTAPAPLFGYGGEAACASGLQGACDAAAGALATGLPLRQAKRRRPFDDGIKIYAVLRLFAGISSQKAVFLTVRPI